MIPTNPLNAAHNITELFILWGKNQVNFLLAASSNKIFATSTIGIKVIQAIRALIKKIDQNIIFPLPFGTFKGAGISFSIDEKNLKPKNNLAIGMSIINAKTMFMRVNISFQCQIWLFELIGFGAPNTLSK